MRLNVHERLEGWRWTLDQDGEGVSNEGVETIMVASSNACFETEREAWENAKISALGILDAFASATIEAGDS